MLVWCFEGKIRRGKQSYRILDYLITLLCVSETQNLGFFFCGEQVPVDHKGVTPCQLQGWGCIFKVAMWVNFEPLDFLIHFSYSRLKLLNTICLKWAKGNLGNSLFLVPEEKWKFFSYVNVLLLCLLQLHSMCRWWWIMAYSKLPYQTRMALSLEYDIMGLIMCLNLSIRKLTEGTWWLFLLPIIISPYTACPPCLPSIFLPHFFIVSLFFGQTSLSL